MYRQRNFSPILIVIIFSIAAALASGIAVYYYSVGKNEVDKKKITEELENLKKEYEKLKAEHEQLKASSLTEKSNAYTNEKDGYSFNYPASWFVAKDSEGVILSNFKYPQEGGTELGENQAKLVINLKNNPEKMNPRTWALNTIGEETTVIKKEELKVGGKDAYKISTKSEMGETVAVYVAKTSTKMLEIINYGNMSELSNILESLKFI